MASGIPPDALLDIEPELLGDLFAAWSKRWTVQDEMLANVVELLHALLRVTVAANTDEAHRSSVPKPFRWPRPHERHRKTVTLRDLARRLAGG